MPKQIDIENVSEVVFCLFYNNFLALSSTFLYFGYIIIIKSLFHVIIQDVFWIVNWNVRAEVFSR